MKQKAVDILAENRLMAIATLGADGWPHNTFVGYANDDLQIYFVVSRQGQKFANIAHDERVSIVIGRDFHNPSSIRALTIAARASEVRDPRQRDRAIDMLLHQRPGLKRLERPNPENSAVMRASPHTITILDYSKGFGHSDVLTVGPGGLATMTPARDDDWGYGATFKPVS